MQLAYDKGERYHENSTAYDAALDDIDTNAVKAYMKRIGYGKPAMARLQENKCFAAYKGDMPQVGAACILLYRKPLHISKRRLRSIPILAGAAFLEKIKERNI